MNASDPIQVQLTNEGGYRFAVRFDDPGLPVLHLDEPAPLGAGSAPNPTRWLAAAIAGCLGSSLRFCLARAHIPIQGLTSGVEVHLVRNAAGRLRVGDVAVRLAPEVTREDAARMRRCLEIFESFCIVTESVRTGFPVQVDVIPRTVGSGLVAGGATAPHNGAGPMAAEAAGGGGS